MTTVFSGHPSSWARPLLGACLLCLSHGLAQAQTATDDSLYQAFGGKPGLTRLMDDFGQRLLADPRMRPFFQDVKMAELKDKLVTQFCQVSGGPCVLKGPTMKQAHDGVDITPADFNALVEVLQDSMQAQGIAFRTQTALLARLAPMHRDIVNAPTGVPAGPPVVKP